MAMGDVARAIGKGLAAGLMRPARTASQTIEAAAWPPVSERRFTVPGSERRVEDGIVGLADGPFAIG
mgnify:CR=1 FL=1